MYLLNAVYNSKRFALIGQEAAFIQELLRTMAFFFLSLIVLKSNTSTSTIKLLFI